MFVSGFRRRWHLAVAVLSEMLMSHRPRAVDIRRQFPTTGKVVPIGSFLNGSRQNQENKYGSSTVVVPQGYPCDGARVKL